MERMHLPFSTGQDVWLSHRLLHAGPSGKQGSCTAERGFLLRVPQSQNQTRTTGCVNTVLQRGQQAYTHARTPVTHTFAIIQKLKQRGAGWGWRGEKGSNTVLQAYHAHGCTIPSTSLPVTPLPPPRLLLNGRGFPHPQPSLFLFGRHHTAFSCTNAVSYFSIPPAPINPCPSGHV